MVGICCLCAKINEEKLLTVLNESKHILLLHLKHCLQVQRYLKRELHCCAECGKMLKVCDDFYRKIKRAQKSLSLLYKTPAQVSQTKHLVLSDFYKRNEKLIAERARIISQGKESLEFQKSKTQNAKNTNETDNEEEIADPLKESEQVEIRQQHMAEKIDFQNEHSVNLFPMEQFDFGTQPWQLKAGDIKQEMDTFDDPLELNNANEVNEQENIQIKVWPTIEEDLNENDNEPQAANLEHSFQDTTTENNTNSGNVKMRVVTHECKQCKKTFISEKIFKLHQKIHDNPLFQCKLCSRTFQSSSALWYHEQTHVNTLLAEGEFKCKICKRTFQRKESLTIHLRSHSTNTPLECKKCLKSFRQPTALYVHLRAHAAEDFYRCENCSKVFYRPEELKQHINGYCKGRELKCTQCSRSFRSSAAYENHMREHSGAPTYECDLCNKKFGTAQSLKNHKYRHLDERRYKCEFCWRGFNCITTLNEHVRIHTRERPFRCCKPNCQKTFMRRMEYARHIRRWHPAERPYECQICKKDFQYQKLLKMHMRTHTDGIQYECKDCSISFADRRSLFTHTHTMHREKVGVKT